MRYFSQRMLETVVHLLVIDSILVMSDERSNIGYPREA